MDQHESYLSTKIPRKWQEALEAEQQTLGCENRVECMGKILDWYFGSRSSVATEQAPAKEMAVMGEVAAIGAAVDTQGAESLRANSDSTAVILQLVDQLMALREALTESQAEARAAQGELEDWRTMKKHAPVAEFLEHASSCPGCKPEIDAYLERAIAGLPVERVKELARAQKWWPPPPIELKMSTRGNAAQGRF